MKYIRTKEGIYKCYATGSLEEINKVYTEDIAIKQADTIEELCDEFVIDKFGVKDLYKELSIGLIQKHLARNHKIYGAIWTDKGLIYVAKMNESGGLELL